MKLLFQCSFAHIFTRSLMSGVSFICDGKLVNLFTYVANSSLGSLQYCLKYFILTGIYNDWKWVVNCLTSSSHKLIDWAGGCCTILVRCYGGMPEIVLALAFYSLWLFYPRFWRSWCGPKGCHLCRIFWRLEASIFWVQLLCRLCQLRVGGACPSFRSKQQ